MENLRNQINQWARNNNAKRDTESDGSIGDVAHQSSRSGHNPDDTPGSLPEWDGDPDNTPEVRAIDVDSDLNIPGTNMQALVNHIVAKRPWTLRYVIYNRKIAEAANDWKWRDYGGSDPHTGHAHFSGAYTQAADNDTSYNYKLEEIPVALTQADKDWIVRAFEEHARDRQVGSTNYPGRTEKQFEQDVADLRGLLVGDDKDGKNIDPDSPIGRIIKAADKILAAS
jgi:hypothetical protein